jgi:CRISPR/Cas system endoribonuclease Cas6 (RAMP superfamily)
MVHASIRLVRPDDLPPAPTPPAAPQRELKATRLQKLLRPSLTPTSARRGEIIISCPSPICVPYLHAGTFRKATNALAGFSARFAQ